MNKLKSILIYSCIVFAICGCTPDFPSNRESAEQKMPNPPSEHVAEAPSTRLILSYGDQTWKLDLKQIGFNGIDPTTLDRSAFNDWLSGIEKELNRLPQSATFENRRIQPHVNGRKLDKGVLISWLDDIHSYVNRPLKAPVQVWQPPVTTDMLKRIQEKQLAVYTTRYNPYNKNRTQNIVLSTKAIDYQVIPEGEVFSFNKVVGIRTTQRGYRPAPIIVKGEYTEGVGGGICQTSSTLYNSVDRAGLRILQRVSHSREVTYVPAGKDATVSWGGPDFRFQNQLNGPILVAAQAKNGLLEVKVYGSRDIRYTPRRTPEPPQKEPETENVPEPEERQPLNEEAREFRNQPLPLPDGSFTGEEDDQIESLVPQEGNQE